ncbi:MAG: hypothetical protein QOF15_670 [Mycobacterium sp.]|nr:hypothetical protein [Mycobacterium sp.]
MRVTLPSHAGFKHRLDQVRFAQVGCGVFNSRRALQPSRAVQRLKSSTVRLNVCEFW